PRSDDHVVLERGMALGARLRPRIDGRRRAAQRHVVIERDVVADLRRFADHHAHAVIGKKPLADSRRGMNFDAGEEPAPLRYEPSQPSPVALPQPMREAMETHGMERRVTKYH